MRGLQLALFIDASNQVRILAGNMVPDIAVATTATLTSDAAAAVGAEAMGSAAIGDASLEIVDRTISEPHRGTVLAWNVPTSRGHVWIDATTGFEVARQDAVMNFDTRHSIIAVPEVPGATIATQVQFDNTDRFTVNGACNTQCAIARIYTLAADDFYRGALGRDGWADTGLCETGFAADGTCDADPVGIIRPNAPYS